MNKFIRYSITLCILTLVFGLFHCGDYSDLVEMRKRATEKYEDALHEARINPILFHGPELNMENPKYFIFEWKSRVPKDGALRISVYVPANGKGEISGALTGEEKDWNYVNGTRDRPINEAMLRTLFELPIVKGDTSERTKRLGKIALAADQMEDIVNFIEIKYKLIDYYAKIGSYPPSLYDLNLDWRLTRDKNGNKYSYRSSGKYVILGTPGADSKWETDSTAVDSIFKDDKEFFHQSGDDLLVKLMPVTR